jgi:YfiH family protein
MPLAIPQQVHGARICVVAGAPRRDPVADGLVTGLPGVAIAISVADCLPLLAYNRRSAVIGVAHCGWRSIAAGIVEEFVGALAGPSRGGPNARFVIGAGIGSCCYEVRGDLLREFAPEEVQRFSTVEDGATRLDLKAIVAHRLAGCGVPSSEVIIDATCTSCNKETLSSYRADRSNCGRMVAFMALAGGGPLCEGVT